MENILVFGHSVTQGFWDEKGGWVQRLRTFLDRRALETQDEEKVFFTFNVGVSGDTTEDLLERIEEEYWRRTEEEYETLLMIEIGANDTIKEDGEIWVEEEEFRSNFMEIIRKSKQMADKVVMVGDFPFDPNLEELPYDQDKKIDQARMERYEEIKKEICREKDVDYIDIFGKFKDQEITELTEEGVHPNSEGHKRMFEEVRDSLQEDNLI